MLVWHRADLHSMLEHDHHAGWRSVIVHDEVNMLNHNAASDGGESNRVSDGYPSGTRACTVCYSALVMWEKLEVMLRRPSAESLSTLWHAGKLPARCAHLCDAADQ